MNAPDNLAHIAAMRARVWDAGFRPVALKSGDKMPLVREWQLRAQRDPPADAVEPARADLLNTGIWCGGLRVVDIDVDDAQAAGGIKAMALDMLGDTIMRTRPNSARVALIYRAAEGQPAKRDVVGTLLNEPDATGKQTNAKVEVLGHGQQLHAFGRHPSGVDLTWHPEPPGHVLRDSLPAVTEAQISAFLAAAAPLIGAETPETKERHHARPDQHDDGRGEATADPLDVAATLAVISNDGPADWEAWNAVAMAVWAATNGSEAGFAMLDAWSARNPAYSTEATRKRWEGITASPPNRTGAGKLFKMAREAAPGWEPPSKAKRTAEAWPEIPLELVTREPAPAPALPPDVFPPRWAEWITLKAELKGTTRDYIAGTILAVVGGIMGNVRWPMPGDGWRETPALRAALVGLPSQGKSQGQAAVTELLSDLEAKENEDWTERQRDYKTEKAAAAERAAQWNKDLKEALGNGLAAPRMPADATEPAKPEKQRIYSTNPTVASAERLSEANPRGMILARDELAGWIASMDQFNATAGADRAFWLEAWNGGRHSPDRKGDGDAPVNIPHLTWAVVGTIQPDRMARLLLSGDDDGMASRFIYIWPATTPLVRARRGLALPPAQEWLGRLRALSWSPPDPIGIPFTDVAEELLFEWRQAVRDMEAEASGLFLSWLGKLPGFAVRLALVFAYLEWCCADRVGAEPAEVGDKDMLRALRFLEDYAVPMARRCFAEATLPQAEADARRLVRWLLKQTPIPEKVNAKELRRMAYGPGIPDAARMTAALEELAGLGVVRRVAPSGKGGRTPSDYDVNPKLRGAGQ